MQRTIFYQKLNDDSSTEHIYDVKYCSRPTATRSYRNLKTMFNNGLISGYGFKIEQ